MKISSVADLNQLSTEAKPEVLTSFDMIDQWLGSNEYQFALEEAARHGVEPRSIDHLKELTAYARTVTRESFLRDVFDRLQAAETIEEAKKILTIDGPLIQNDQPPEQNLRRIAKALGIKCQKPKWLPSNKPKPRPAASQKVVTKREKRRAPRRTTTSASKSKTPETDRPTTPPTRRKVHRVSKRPQAKEYVNSLLGVPGLQRAFLNICKSRNVFSDLRNAEVLDGQSMHTTFRVESRKKIYKDAGSGVEVVYFSQQEQETLALHLRFKKHRWALTSPKAGVTTHIDNACLSLQVFDVRTNDEKVAMAIIPAIPRDFDSNEDRLKLFGTDEQYGFSPSGIARTLEKKGLPLRDRSKTSAERIEQLSEELERATAALEESEEDPYLAAQWRKGSNSLAMAQRNRFFGLSLSRLTTRIDGKFDSLLSTIHESWISDLKKLATSGDLKRIYKIHRSLAHGPEIELSYDFPFLRLTPSAPSFSAGFHGSGR